MKKLKMYNSNSIQKHPIFKKLQPCQQEAIVRVSKVLPFRVNNYVLEELIDFSNIPNDPIFQLTFLQPNMLIDVLQGTDPKLVRDNLNPHPADQVELNVPFFEGSRVEGVQHKYSDVALLFPKEGQQCHSYCTFCFRWAQFVPSSAKRFETDSEQTHIKYFSKRKEIQDVILTGGDPMIMSAEKISQYINPLLKIPHIKNIRVGSKSLSFWPYRFISDSDADQVLRLFEKIHKAGKSLLFMAHISHYQEMVTEVFLEAVRRIRETGAIIKTQSPILDHINAHEDVWQEMWSQQLKLGMIPYYMFQSRPTGPKDYFAVPIKKSFEIYNSATKDLYGQISELRGPVMSTSIGKCQVMNVSENAGETLFKLKLIRARDKSKTDLTIDYVGGAKTTWIEP